MTVAGEVHVPTVASLRDGLAAWDIRQRRVSSVEDAAGHSKVEGVQGHRNDPQTCSVVDLDNPGRRLQRDDLGCAHMLRMRPPGATLPYPAGSGAIDVIYRAPGSGPSKRDAVGPRVRWPGAAAQSRLATLRRPVWNMDLA